MLEVVINRSAYKPAGCKVVPRCDALVLAVGPVLIRHSHGFNRSLPIAADAMLHAHHVANVHAFAVPIYYGMLILAASARGAAFLAHTRALSAASIAAAKVGRSA